MSNGSESKGHTAGVVGRTLTKAAPVIDRYWPISLTIVGTCILAFSTNLIPEWNQLLTLSRGSTALWWIGAVCFCGGSWTMTTRQKPLEALAVENQGLRDVIKQFGDTPFETWHLVLSGIASELGLTDRERVSFYSHEPGVSGEPGHFIMLGRYSADATKCHRGRGIYPDDEGCIGEAFRLGTCFADEQPTTDEEGFVDHVQERWNIPPKAAAEITMRPRVLAAFAVGDGVDRKAVVVFESENAEGLDEPRLKQAIKGKEAMLVRLRSVLRPLEPSPAFAKRQGF